MGRIPYLSILGILLLGGGCAMLMLGYKTFAPGLYETYEAVGFNKTLSEVYWLVHVNQITAKIE